MNRPIFDPKNGVMVSGFSSSEVGDLLKKYGTSLEFYERVADIVQGRFMTGLILGMAQNKCSCEKSEESQPEPITNPEIKIIEKNSDEIVIQITEEYRGKNLLIIYRD